MSDPTPVARVGGADSRRAGTRAAHRRAVLAEDHLDAPVQAGQAVHGWAVLGAARLDLRRADLPQLPGRSQQPRRSTAVDRQLRRVHHQMRKISSGRPDPAGHSSGRPDPDA